MDSTDRKILLTICIVIGVILLAAATPPGRYLWNRWFFNVQKADDITNYATIKKVEDTARSMISSYNADVLTYNQYKNYAIGTEQFSWAEQAKMRANKTASTYNNYILENSFIWKENVPKDILDELPYVE